MSETLGDYHVASIEQKWQAYWEEHKSFRTPNPGEEGFDKSKRKYYALDMFPYPSGAGLHVGHPEGYTATDILSRYRRMLGFNVLHPMGWDAFGLPAEQHAVDTGTHPRITTEKNINNFRRQLKLLGFSYDWDREVSTTDPEYYRWTQWIFLQLFNSWYDDAAQKARPIAELEKELEAGVRVVRFDRQAILSGQRGMQQYSGAPIGTRNWHELTAAERAGVLAEHRLAYLAEVPVNWCPALGTVLSNEEVTNEGKSDRGNHPVFRRPLRQWMLRITKYADRLAQDLEELAWPESVKLMQRNWIGRSEGAQVRFRIDGRDDEIEIFTTRPDTLFGATYMVLAPEHPLVEQITTPRQEKAVREYCIAASRRSELDRTADAKTKSGVDTGAYAINPVDGDRIPIWVADYVLMGYGTGAIMAVPAHDERDFEFARQFDLPVVAVVMPDDAWLKAHWRFEPLTSIDALRSEYMGSPGGFKSAFSGDGVAINSGDYNLQPTAEFTKNIIAHLEKEGLGRRAVNYKLRDWLFSRQRYWGEPFPILHGPNGEIVALDESELPLTLPDIDDYRPTVSASGDENSAMPEPPLSRAKEWVTVQRDGKTWRRELNTMPQWAGSCWYYLRFLDPRNNQEFCSREAEKYWMVSPRKDGTPHVGGIDLYLGGAEHAVLHLLYARFWHKVLYDLGHVSTVEPFGKLFNQGMIRAFAYRDSRDIPVGYDEIDFREDGAHHRETGEKLSGAVEKMSKSLKNVINPEEVVREYGGDSLRLYEMFMGPLEASKPWNPRDVPGVFRFLQRAWRMIVEEQSGKLVPSIAESVSSDSPDFKPVPATDPLERALHKTIKKVTDDLERMAFNTAISAMMEFVNEAHRAKTIRRDQAERFVLILAPFAPHIAEELWQRLRGLHWKESLTYEPWPTFNMVMVVDTEVEIPVQINGKMAGRITIAPDADEATARNTAMADAKVQEKLAGLSIVKAIYVPGRMLNLVVKK